VRPELMCKSHRSGEHLECHMFVGSIQQMRALNGYYSTGLFFGPKFLKHRHKELRRFIQGHKSPLIVPKTIAKITSRVTGLWYPDVLPTEDQMWLSWHTLMSRCEKCRKKHLKAKREGKPYRYSLDPSIVLAITRSIRRNKRNQRNT
jgi:hypothetical protein